MHRSQRGGRNQFLAIKRALAEFQAHPGGQIGNVGVRPARGRLRVRIALLRGDLPPPVALDVRNRPILARHIVREAGTGAGHRQRPLETLLAQIFPGRACGMRRGNGGGGESEVGIGVALAEAVLRLEKAQSLEDGVPIESQVFQQITAMITQPAAMGKEVSQGSWSAKPGLMSDSRLVQVAPPVPTTEATTVAERDFDTEAS